MSVTLTDELEELINERIKSGAYQSADEVIGESLRLLKAREQGTAALRQEIMRGVEDIRLGRFASYSTDVELVAFSDKIISESEHDSPKQK